MMLAFAGLFLFGIFLLGLGALSFALWVALKVLEWTMRLILWLLDSYADDKSAELEPLEGGIVININIVDDDEELPMRDVTPPRW
jgi:hypothetical protein